MKFAFPVVLGLAAVLAASDVRAQGFAPRRPTTGERITAQAEMKSQMRAAARHEYQAQQQRYKAQRSYGSQDFWKGPKGDVINGRDLPPNAQQSGYRYRGSVNFGQPFRPQ
jgi:hypothetical protein